MAVTDFARFHPDFPVTGATVTAGENRRMLAALAEQHRAVDEASLKVPAILAGDRFIGKSTDTIDLTTGKHINLQVRDADGTLRTTAEIDCQGSDTITSSRSTQPGPPRAAPEPSPSSSRAT